MTDFRLPTTIPEGALLYGGKLGEVKILPKGEPGDVLIINEDGFFSWRKIFVPDRKLTPPSRLPPPLCTPGTNIPSSPSITFNLDKIELAE